MSTTLEIVERLFRRLDEEQPQSLETMGSCMTHPEDPRRAWREYIKTIRKVSDTAYQDDGHPVVFGAPTSCPNVHQAIYRWASSEYLLPTPYSESVQHRDPPAGVRKLICDAERWAPIDWTKAKGCIFYIHGITENARFSLLSCEFLAKEGRYGWDGTAPKAQRNRELDEAMLKSELRYTVDESVLEAFLRAGFVVYAPDLQGHGLSSAWRGSRCNVEHFEHLVTDSCQALCALVKMNEISSQTSIFAMGMSLGGCITTRAIQEGFSQGLFGVSKRRDEEDLDEELIEPEDAPIKLRGMLLYCPALGTEKLKKRFPNYLLLPFAQYISKKFPTARMASLAPNELFTWIPKWIRRDALMYTQKIPLRISAETVDTIDRVFPRIGEIDPALPIQIIQSKNDTMTDPEGSQKFIDAYTGPDRNLVLLEYGWHFLTKEAGFLNTAKITTEWLLQRC